jgi:hypothetical protein
MLINCLFRKREAKTHRMNDDINPLKQRERESTREDKVGGGGGGLKYKKFNGEKKKIYGY